MEEFRSTEILDKEIYDDARKKADRLLSSAETDGQKILNDVLAKIEKTTKEKEAQCDDRIAQYKSDLDAALPLEKERFLVTYESNAIEKAVSDYVYSLSKDKIMTLLSSEFTRYTSYLAGKDIKIHYHGLDEKDVKNFAKNHIEKSAKIEYDLLSDANAIELHAETGMLIESSDGSVRCRITVAELIEKLLDIKRFELTDVLFCGRLSND